MRVHDQTQGRVSWAIVGVLAPRDNGCENGRPNRTHSLLYLMVQVLRVPQLSHDSG